MSLIMVFGSVAKAAPISTERIRGGPALAGDRVAWAESRLRGTDVTVKSAVADGSSRRTLMTALEREVWFATIAGSATRLSVGVYSGFYGFRADGDNLSFSTFVGQPAGSTTRLGSCLDYSGLFVSAIADTSGDRVAYWDCEHYAVAVRDYSSALPAQMFEGGPELRLAGRYLAVRRYEAGEAEIVVYDTLTGTPAYVVDAGALGGDPYQFDVAEDGSLAVAHGRGAPHGNRIAWASPEHPSPSDIASGEFVLRVRFARPGAVVYSSTPNVNHPGKATIRLTGPGRRERVLVDRTDGAHPDFDFDADATRLAWFDYSCTGARIHVRSLKARVSHPTLPSHCDRLRLDGPGWWGGYGRTVITHPDCYGFDNRPYCIRPGSFVVTGTGDERGVLIARGGRWNRVRLTDEGLRLLNRKESLRVRGTAVFADALGRRERRSGTFRVVFD